MQAMIYTRYGSADVLHAAELPTPIPQPGEVLVRVHAAGINSADVRLLRGQPFMVRLSYGLFRPKHRILGSDIAGRVEAVGQGVTRFRPGDAVYGDTSACGLGGFAEYVAVPETALAALPPTLGYEAAAAVPMAGVTALQALRDRANIRVGERVAINGAAGGVGTFAVQIAHALGAEVTAIASPDKLDLLRELGAAHVIDYTRADFTARADQYDVILGVNGYHPLAHYARALKPGGRYVMVGGTDAQIFEALLLAPLMRKRAGRRLISLMAKANAADLHTLAEWLERGTIKPVLQACYPLAQLVEAMRVLEAGHARGKLVITLAAR